MNYSKPPISIEAQLEILKERGLVVRDASKACHFLRYIGYYRLAGYGRAFQKTADDPNHEFKAGTSFDDLLALYSFDRELRLLAIDAIERIEVACRAAISNEMALASGDPHWFCSASHFKAEFKHSKFLNDLKKEVDRSRDQFIQHYKNTYASPALPPSWMVTEIASLGVWSKVYMNLEARQRRVAIAHSFDLRDHLLDSWLHSITILRNLCAHHSRIWNRHFIFAPKRHQSHAAHFSRPNAFYTQCFLLQFLMKKISPETSWPQRLYDLIHCQPDMYLAGMGFAPDWHRDPFWPIQP